MTTRFFRNPEISAREPPLRPVRRNSPAADARVGEQVRELVPERATDFIRAVLVEAGIERDEPRGEMRAAGGTAHARIPFHADGCGELWRARGGQNAVRDRFEFRITSEAARI